MTDTCRGQVDCTNHTPGAAFINPCSCQSYYFCADRAAKPILRTCTNETFWDQAVLRCELRVDVHLKRQECVPYRPWERCKRFSTDCELKNLRAQCEGKTRKNDIAADLGNIEMGHQSGSIASQDLHQVDVGILIGTVIGSVVFTVAMYTIGLFLWKRYHRSKNRTIYKKSTKHLYDEPDQHEQTPEDPGPDDGYIVPVCGSGINRPPLPLPKHGNKASPGYTNRPNVQENGTMFQRNLPGDSRGYDVPYSYRSTAEKPYSKGRVAQTSDRKILG